MLAAAGLALIQLFAWKSLLYMSIGVIFGLIMGILPGLGGIITLSLLIPFVYGMNPAEAFALLLGAESAVAFGGAITAILLNVPGTSENVATCWDGFPLTKQGQGARGIYAAGIATALGSIFGTIILVATIPVVRPLVLTFGPAEYFMLALMGIAVIALLTGKSVVKGVISGGLGLLLAMVGEDPVSGDYRFTLGLINLYDGFEFAAFVIGIFAVAEMIETYVSASAIARKRTASLGTAGVWAELKEVLQHWRTLLRSSIIGTIIGIIPGVGGSVANVVAYGYEVRSAKDPRRFGKGAIEGVIAPQAADNAREGGALIPTIAFGIPGSGGMAILLGAFLILGLIPGQEMFTKHLDTVFVMAWTIVAGNLLATFLGIAATGWLEKVAHLRPALLVPGVLVISYIGAYAINNSMFEVLTAVIFGFLGYWMKKYDYSRQTMVIGLVLGGIVEKNYQLAYQLYGWHFFLRPYTLLILLLGVLVFLLPYLRKPASQQKGGVPA